MKAKVLLISIVILVVVLSFREVFIYKTFQEVVGHQLNENTEIDYITVRLNHFADDIKDESHAIIKDKELIDDIVNGFSNMKLKKTNKAEHRYYYLSIITTNKVGENHYSTESLNLEFDDKHITIDHGYSKHFDIVSDTNHLKAIQSLIENDDIEWVKR